MSASADQCFMRKPPSCFSASIIYEHFVSLSTYVYLPSTYPSLGCWTTVASPPFFPLLSFFLFSLPPISITSSPCFFPLSRRGEEKNRVPFIDFQSRENALRWRIGTRVTIIFFTVSLLSFNVLLLFEMERREGERWTNYLWNTGGR